MKKLIKGFIKWGMYSISIVFPANFFKKITEFFNLLYSFWLFRQFKDVKGDAYFAYPIYLKGGNYIVLGENFGSDQRLRLDAYSEYLGDKFFPEITFGNNVSIQKDCHIAAINKIIIGNNVLIGSRVFISDHSHGEIINEELSRSPVQRRLYSKGPVIVDNNVWIGEGVTILPGVTIGENSIIGANSVVSKSIPKNTVAAGNPARVIREIS